MSQCKFARNRKQCGNSAVDEREYCLEHGAEVEGCQFKVRASTVNNIALWCHQMVSANGAYYCPKHEVILSEGHLDVEAKMQKARNGKARKEMMREALKSSPLAVVVAPEMEEKTYSR